MMDDPRQKISLVKLQLLCIVSGSRDAYGSSKGQYGYTYYSRQRHNQAKNTNFSIMFLFHEIDSRIGQVVYMIERKSSNERLWGRNYQVCYNGVLTIGTYITILNHFPILNRLVNEITILESRHSAVIM